MLGKEFHLLLKKWRIPFVATDIDVDITNRFEIFRFLGEKEIDFVINCAAYTNVDGAEDDKEDAFLLNQIALSNLVDVAMLKDAVLFHFSTDYVFNGAGSQYFSEKDVTAPESIYGKSKLAGEHVILKSDINFFIFRISWLYGIFGKCFPKTMIDLLKSKDEIKVVNDQVGAPTWAKTLAENVIEIIKDNNKNYGLYHYSDLGEISWYEYASELQKLAIDYNVIEKTIKILPVSSAEFSSKAVRPLNSRLDKGKLTKTFNIQLNDWKVNLEKFVSELTKYEKA